MSITANACRLKIADREEENSRREMRFVVSKIKTCTKLGYNFYIFGCQLSDSNIKKLRAQGFTVRRTGYVDTNTTVSW
jgi:hypothetical protein